MSSLPTGTVTFLFTDIEGSTALLQRLGDRRYAEVLEEHRRLLRAAFEEEHGREVSRHGDAFLVAFSRAREAVAAAVAGQQALAKHAWPDGASLRVRMGLHTGEAVGGIDDYAGLDVHRAARIAAAGHGGQILLSDAVQVLAARDLPAGVSLRDLGTHRLKDLKEPEHLLQVVHPDLPVDFPPLKALEARTNNLPIQLTSFVGREREIAEVKRLLGAARLVTLTGSGGAGKTRLALQVAAEVLDDYPDGAWLAELAPIADAALVPKIVASAMSVSEQPGREITGTLVDVLRSKTVLLGFDNCEHLLAACRDLTVTLLRACPHIRILATSRERLGVPGETVWRVPSLSVPEDVRHLPPPEELVMYDAIRLFADRALATTPGFAITPDNAPSVAQVCQRLDGIPLAIELAAARVKVLAAEQIASRLDDRFRLLTGGSPTVLPRHQTLGAAIDWSYNLLSETERVLLRRLSVFAGGWTLEAAEAVCAGGGLNAASILDLLASLADKSLIIAETQRGEARYRLLETVRQYGIEKLQDAAEDSETQGRHRDWFLSLAEQTNTETFGPNRARLDRLEAEHDNFRTALRSAKKADDVKVLVRIAAALHSLWFYGGHWREGREWLEEALTYGDRVDPSIVPKILIGATHLTYLNGDHKRAVALGEKGLALARNLGGSRYTSRLLYFLGIIAKRQGDYARATGLFEESLNLDGDWPRKWQVALILNELGTVARRQRRYERAQTLLTESLAHFREIGSKWGIAYALGDLALVTLDQGDYKRAREQLVEALPTLREVRDQWTLPQVVRGLGAVALHEADYGSATRSFKEGLVMCMKVGNRWIGEECLDGLAETAAAQGQYERSARLFGAAEAQREGLGRSASVDPTDPVLYESSVAVACSGLGDAAFSTAWAEGRAMTLEQAIEYALAGDTG